MPPKATSPGHRGCDSHSQGTLGQTWAKHCSPQHLAWEERRGGRVYGPGIEVHMGQRVEGVVHCARALLRGVCGAESPCSALQPSIRGRVALFSFSPRGRGVGPTWCRGPGRSEKCAEVSDRVEGTRRWPVQSSSVRRTGSDRILPLHPLQCPAGGLRGHPSSQVMGMAPSTFGLVGGRR